VGFVGVVKCGAWWWWVGIPAISPRSS